MAAVETICHSIDVDGFVQLPGFIRTQELTTLRAILAQEKGSNVDGACERPHNTLLPLRWNDPIVGLALGDGTRVARLRESVSASDLRWISGYISIKEPRTPPLWWHQDWWCWDHPVSFRSAPAQLALLIYLSDTTSDNGALRVLPGSHHRSSPIHRLLPEAHGTSATELGSTHPALANLQGQRTLSVRAGDAVALDYRLLHGTHENASDLRRDALLLTFTPSWRELPDDVRAHLIQHPALPSGDEAYRTQNPWEAEMLPEWHGPLATLPLNRNAPREFDIAT
jgi:Phytanoyl-CoA dioxygenase (PhyH)